MFQSVFNSQSFIDLNFETLNNKVGQIQIKPFLNQQILKIHILRWDTYSKPFIRLLVLI